MAESTSRYSFADLLLRLAKKAGIAYYGATDNEKAMIPIDVFNLELCKDIANDGIKMFIADAPKRGWRWVKRIMSVTLSSAQITGIADATTDATHLVDLTLASTYTTTDELKDYYAYILTGTGIGSFAKITAYNKTTGSCTVGEWLDEYGNTGGTTPLTNDTFAITSVETVGGDIARYPLSEDFGGEPMGKIEYAANTSHAGFIEWRNESFIRARRSVTVTTSYPRWAAIRRLEPAISDLENGSAKRRYELFLDPQPVAADVLEFPYNLVFDKLDLETGKATDGANTTMTDTNRTEGNSYFDGWKVEIVSGTGKGSNAIVTGYVGSTGVFTVDDWLTVAGAAAGTNPAADSIYVVAPLNNTHPAGASFDEGILAACYAKLEMEEDELQEGLEEHYIKKALPLAHNADARTAPRTMGSMNRYSGRRGLYDGRFCRNWLDVTTDHDV